MAKLLSLVAVVMLLAFVGCQTTISEFNINENIKKFTTSFKEIMCEKTSNENTFAFTLPTFVWLGLTVLGASGQTADEIWQALSIQKAADRDAFKDTIFDLVHELGQHSLIEFSSKIFFNKGNIKSDFLELAETKFEFATKTMDINNPANWEEMGAWVNQRLHNDSRNQADTVLVFPNDYVLLSTLYFKAEWEQTFDQANTVVEPFYTSTGDAVNVDMMHLEADLLYDEHENFQSVYLRYKDSNMYIMIVLPNNDDGLKIICNEHIYRMTKPFGIDTKRVKLSLPRFSLKSAVRLSNILPEMGVTTMFAQDADFKNMFQSPNHVSSDSTMTYASFEVNEWGTGSIPDDANEPKAKKRAQLNMVASVEFKADHPFIFAIIDGQTNLGTGFVANPQDN